ncbi:MAG TPA: right-handed parallel beta-helix repeat-containing protein, partial [Tepidisphaeraceae bacterium]|nr:right-handed parallel beta-helix repeat-containing protein [Tepidisphaeraceae bacterium]
LAAPYRTVGKAAAVAKPGDVVYIRGGTYRETVRPANSGLPGKRITFRSYPGERATISGTDVVTGWRSAGGSSYDAAMPWTLGAGNDQVFVDGRMVFEARWPSTPSLDVMKPIEAIVDSAAVTVAGPASGPVTGGTSTAVLKDAAFQFPAGTWDGAMIHFLPGEGWFAQSGTVLSSKPGELTIRYQQMSSLEKPGAGTRYFLLGKRAGFDANGEFYRDPGTRRLALRTPGGDDPAKHTVEVKRRAHAFDLRGRSNVDVMFLNLFAAAMATDKDTDYVSYTGLNARYPTHFTTVRSYERGNGTGQGLNLVGDYGSISYCSVEYSAGDGIGVHGIANRVEHNTVRYADYNGSAEAGINASWAWDTVVRRNKVFDVGREGIKTSFGLRQTITHNVVERFGRLTTDVGGIYTWGTDSGGTTIAYNRVSRGHGTGRGGHVGIYLDNDSRKHSVHHNLVFDVDVGIRMNPTSYDNKIFNNTLLASRYGLATYGSKAMPGCVFYNNVFDRPVMWGSGAVQADNLVLPASYAFPMFAASSTGNYTLAPGSPGIDTGRIIVGVTDGYVGAKPDKGAYEHGVAAWVAG